MNSESGASAVLLQQLNLDTKAKEQKLILKWKFILILFSLALLALIGICSSLVASIAKSKNPTINTTFLNSLLIKSDFLKGDLGPVRNFINIFNQTDFMKFDKVQDVLSNGQYSANQIAQSLKSKSNILAFIQLEGQQSSNSKFGMFLHPQFPDFDSEKQDFSIRTADYKEELISVLFSLESQKFIVLNKSQSCYIYQYSQKVTNMSLSFMQFMHFNDDSNSSSAVPAFSIQNYACFAEGKQTKPLIEKQISQIVGVEINYEQVVFVIKRMQMFSLSMENQGESTS